MSRLTLAQGRTEQTVLARPKLISVLSGKGGVGKSVLAFNLAERISHSGRKVLLVDADAWCGNLHILSNVQAEKGFQQFADGRISLPEAAVRVNDRLDVLPVVADAMDDEPLTSDDAGYFIQRLKRQGTGYDLVILDHSSGRSRSAAVMACGCDATILVMVPELTSISDCYGLYKYLSLKDSGIDCRLLLNRTESAEEAEYIKGKFFAISSRFLGMIPGDLGAVGESSAVKQAVARQMPVAAVEPEAPVLQALTAVGQALVSDLLLTRPRSVINTEKTINKSPQVADTKG